MTTTALRGLTGLFNREFLRNGFALGFSLGYPLLMMGVFALLGVLIPEDEGSRVDPWLQLVPLVTFIAVTSVGLVATAPPWATMRIQGQLRLLSSTPATRQTVLLAHLAARIPLILIQLLLIVLFGVWIGTVDLASVPTLYGVSLLGVVLFVALGYLIGSMAPSPDSASSVTSLLQVLLLFASGFVLPLEVFPDSVADVLRYVPTTFYADLLTGQMIGGEQFHPTWLSVLVLLVSTAVVLVFTVRTFKWDAPGR